MKLIVGYDKSKYSIYVLEIVKTIQKERKDILLEKRNCCILPVCYIFNLFHVPFILISLDSIIRYKTEDSSITKQKLNSIIDFIKERFIDTEVPKKF